MFILIQLLVFSLVSIALDKPIGSITGKVTLEKAGFNLQFADLKVHQAYVTATGPRGQPAEERGVWVTPDGSFRIDHLVKGEYLVKVHANGYSSAYINDGVFVDDGQITPLRNVVSLSILHPSISIASNRKVFTSKESPYFWLNCSGANKAKVRLYKTDIVKLMRNKLAEKNRNRFDDDTNDGNKTADQVEVENQNGAGEQSKSGKNAVTQIYSSINFGNNFALYKNYNCDEPKFLTGQKPVAVLHRSIESNQEDWANLQFKLTKPLPYGDYIGLAEASNSAGEKEWDIFWFNVSDLAWLSN